MGDQEIIEIELAEILQKAKSFISHMKEVQKKTVFVRMMTLEASTERNEEEDAELRDLKIENLEITDTIQAKELFVKNYELHVKRDIANNNEDAKLFEKHSEECIKKLKEYSVSTLITIEQRKTIKGIIGEYPNAIRYNLWSKADYWRMLSGTTEIMGNYISFKRDKTKIPVHKINKPLSDSTVMTEKNDKIIKDAEKQGIPIFIFTAKDKFALEQLINYRDSCEADCSNEHYKGIEKRIDEWVDWQDENKDIIKIPD